MSNRRQKKTVCLTVSEAAAKVLDHELTPPERVAVEWRAEERVFDLQRKYGDKWDLHVGKSFTWEHPVIHRHITLYVRVEPSFDGVGIVHIGNITYENIPMRPRKDSPEPKSQRDTPSFSTKLIMLSAVAAAATLFFEQLGLLGNAFSTVVETTIATTTALMAFFFK